MFRRAFAMGCNTLKRIAVDTSVLNDLRRAGMRQQQFWAEYQEICGNVRHFVQDFCELENDVLIAAGINRPAAESLIREAKLVRASVKDLRINAGQVQQNLRTMSDEACEIASLLHNLPMQRQEKNKTRNRFKRFCYGIG